MGNFTGFAYGICVESQSGRRDPLAKREIIRQALVIEPQENPRFAVLAMLREAAARVVAGLGQRLERADHQIG